MIEHPSSQVPSRPNHTETSYGAQEDAQQVLYLQAEGACRLRLGKAELMKERWSLESELGWMESNRKPQDGSCLQLQSLAFSSMTYYLPGRQLAGRAPTDVPSRQGRKDLGN